VAALVSVAVLVVVVLAVALVGLYRPAGPVEPTGATPTGEPAVTPVPVAEAVPVWPLTGLPVTDPGDPDRPAVAVKVSDVRQAHPQVGIDRADVVFVEPVGVAYTRLAAVFHSEIPVAVGPVRSARPMDAPLLSPTRGVLASTMAAGWVMSYLDETADVDHLGSLRVPRGTAYETVAGRPSPDHVLVRPPVLLDLTDRSEPPPPSFGYATDAASSSAGRSGTSGTALTVPYGPSWDVGWTWDAATGTYLRSQPWGPHVAADGTRVSAANVLVLRVDSRVEKLAEGSGKPVPVLQLVDASGELTALTDGKAVTGTWSKAGVHDPFVLTTSAGQPLRLAPGRTWVEMPTPQADVVVR